MARRLLSRVLWAGGLAAAGTVVCAISAGAAEGDHATEQPSGLLSSLTAAADPLASLTGSLVGEAETLLDDDLALGDDTLLAADLADVVGQPLTGVTSAIGIGSDAIDEQSALAEQRAAVAPVEDRSFDRSRAAEPADESAEGDDTAGSGQLFGSVDSLLVNVETLVPGVASNGAEFADGVLNGSLADEGFSTLERVEPLAAVTDAVSLFNLPILHGLPVLDQVSPLLGSLDSLVRTAIPAATGIDSVLGVADVTSLLGQAWHEPFHGTLAPAPTLDHLPLTSTATSPHGSFDELGGVTPVGFLGSKPAVLDSSPTASQVDTSSPADSRGGPRPSWLMTPVAGITALHAGAPGAAISADQAGPSSLALLPEEAVLRARLFSAAAYARSIEVRPLREANDPPVSPD